MNNKSFQVQDLALEIRIVFSTMKLYIEVTKNMLNGITTMHFQQQIISASNAQILCLKIK